MSDERERGEALNPSQSFIIQAPAGSGKTELLTQRFLVLLSHVKQPEEILAITFTKKAAAEMRARIINTLNNALCNDAPTTAHAKKTWDLARKVLEQDHLFQWDLLSNPNRMRIQTIDSFSVSLTKHLPMLSYFGSSPEITDDPTALYRQAVQEFLQHLEEDLSWSDAIATLLRHLDNDLNKVEGLLITLLAKRDQWLPYITNEPELRHKLEAYLQSVVTESVVALNQAFPKKHIEEMATLARYAAKNCPESVISYCVDLSGLPKNSNQWLGIADILLKKDLDWRKRLDKTVGFPTPDMKPRMSELIDELSCDEVLHQALKELRLAPDVVYRESQWQALEALQQVLRIVVAQLKVVFQQHGKIDYIENSQAALMALGTEDAPTDLTLALDYQIKHILVDEFQDTSNSQFRLLEKLTAGWETRDGRTLFLVGDPMQSIYRFREAEVGLFIRAQQKGVGHVQLIPLKLSVNFRSSPEIVNWVNESFPKIFPRINNIVTGAVSYSQSTASKPPSIDLSGVALHPVYNANDEAQANAIIQLIQQRKPDEKIAILVKSRTHLKAIIPALKAAEITYRAIDIDPLTERPLIQDLMALTRALLHPADRIAWLAILRAPWCGMTLSDLLILSGNQSSVSLWERLHSAEVLQTLSQAGQDCLKRILPILDAKMAERCRLGLRIWIESTWLMLGGPACIQQSTDLEDATSYFRLLEKLDQNRVLLDLNNLSDYVRRLFASPNNQADDTLQIMTIHNAKGLEFDTVILPHLEKKSPSDDKQLLLWMERPREDESSALILAPIHATGDDGDSIYDYVKRQSAMKLDHEYSRLLYVAVTRAKKNLHLFFNLKTDKEKLSVLSSSLLNKLMPAIETSLPISAASSYEKVNVLERVPQQNKRLQLGWKNPITENKTTLAFHNKTSGFMLLDSTAKHIGTIVHAILQMLSSRNITQWDSIKHADYLKSQLAQLGVMQSQIPAAMDKINQAIHATLKDPRGQWILFQHLEAKSEFHLTAVIDSVPCALVLDRTFIDENGVRWVVDYKTATPDDEDLSSFLESESQKYEKQMRQYYLALKELDKRPIRLGLYFPLISAWHELIF